MSLADKLKIVNTFDTGLRRPHNEDSTLSDIDHGLIVLADGMGIQDRENDQRYCCDLLKKRYFPAVFGQIK